MTHMWEEGGRPGQAWTILPPGTQETPRVARSTRRGSKETPRVARSTRRGSKETSRVARSSRRRSEDTSMMARSLDQLLVEIPLLHLLPPTRHLGKRHGKNKKFTTDLSVMSSLVFPILLVEEVVREVSSKAPEALGGAYLVVWRVGPLG